MSDLAEPHPVDGATFARLMAPFGPFEARPELAVAVSGGRDSLCLTLLAHEWSAGRGGRVLALIVDHGLRPESAMEASVTATLLLVMVNNPYWGFGRRQAAVRPPGSGACRPIPAAARRLP